MGHLPELIHDLALILMVAAVVVLLFKRIGQPLVLGYIIAGFLVGPHFNLLPSVIDAANLKTLAEIGVIFLLFSLGLEFSFKKLMNVGGAASITAFVEIIVITLAGYFCGQMLGWTKMDSMFLGGMLASSSTTIIIRAFDELGVKTKQFARTVFGVLVVEDIVVILLMVLLSTIAVTNEVKGSEIIFTIGKLVFFLILWFILGIFLLPTILKKSKKFLDDEILLILSIGLCLGMVLLATSVGFSAELGAFIMGSIIAETVLAEKVEHLLKGVKDLFGSIFFISVGMMIDPKAIITYGGPIAIVTVLTILGKALASAGGALLSGQPLKQSVQVGMSMAQIGEFAFIVATLGLSLGVISDFLFPVAVGVSAVTTFTTPYLIQSSDAVYNGLVKILPKSWIDRISNYTSETQMIRSGGEIKNVMKTYARIMLVNGTILVALVLLFSRFMMPLVNEYVDSPLIKTILNVVLPILIGLPFLWAFMVKKPETLDYASLLKNKEVNHGPLYMIELGRFILGTLILGFLIEKLGSTLLAFIVVIPCAILFMFIFSKQINKLYSTIENRFLGNLNARETFAESQIEPLQRKTRDLFQSWELHIVELQVNPNAAFINIPLQQLKWREQYGINIAYIRRGGKIIHRPSRYEVL
ncbi:MAG TPA: cation:proton antiporter, partial [Flavihumibacter sp.]